MNRVPRPAPELDRHPDRRAARRAARRPARTAARTAVRGGALVAALGASLAAAAALAQQPFDVTLRDGLLSIRANGASAVALADALSGETGISFAVTGDTDQAITAEIVDEPLARAIATLSPNHLLVRDGKGADAPLVEVVLMLDDAAGSVAAGGEDQFLPSGDPADEIAAGDVIDMPEAEAVGDAMRALIDTQAIDRAAIDGADGTSLDAGAGADPLNQGYDELPPEEALGADGQPLGQ